VGGPCGVSQTRTTMKVMVCFLHFLLFIPLTPSNSTIAKNNATGNLHPSEAQTPCGHNDTLGGMQTISRRGEPNAGVGWEAPLRSRKPRQDEDTPPTPSSEGVWNAARRKQRGKRWQCRGGNDDEEERGIEEER
jgi:hypothetical protein